MPTKKPVRDSNAKSLAGKNKSKKSDASVPEGAVQVTHGNAPLLAVKLLAEIRDLLKEFKNG